MKSKSIVLVIINTFSLIVMLFANYASTAGIFSKASVADISHKYDTLFAPSGYAFIIWAFLFLLAIVFVGYQWVLLKKDDPKKYIKRTGIWFTLSNFANAGWLYLWTNEMIGWSVTMIFLLLLCLIILTIRLRLELDDEPVRNIFFVWWPITFYLGWIMVATIACVASWLVSQRWQVANLPENIWTIIMLVIACLFYLLLIIKRNMREASMVGIWAFIGIAIRQWENHPDIAIAAIIVSAILFIASAAHVYKNRKYIIGAKIKRGEW